jgi:formylmethanofuran dehydrogenase subunit E
MEAREIFDEYFTPIECDSCGETDIVIYNYEYDAHKYCKKCALKFCEEIKDEFVP